MRTASKCVVSTGCILLLFSLNLKLLQAIDVGCDISGSGPPWETRCVSMLQHRHTVIKPMNGFVKDGKELGKAAGQTAGKAGRIVESTTLSSVVVEPSGRWEQNMVESESLPFAPLSEQGTGCFAAQGPGRLLTTHSTDCECFVLQFAKDNISAVIESKNFPGQCIMPVGRGAFALKDCSQKEQQQFVPANLASSPDKRICTHSGACIREAANGSALDDQIAFAPQDSDPKACFVDSTDGAAVLGVSSDRNVSCERFVVGTVIHYGHENFEIPANATNASNLSEATHVHAILKSAGRPGKCLGYISQHDRRLGAEIDLRDLPSFPSLAHAIYKRPEYQKGAWRLTRCRGHRFQRFREVNGTFCTFGACVVSSDSKVGLPVKTPKKSKNNVLLQTKGSAPLALRYVKFSNVTCDAGHTRHSAQSMSWTFQQAKSFCESSPWCAGLSEENCGSHKFGFCYLMTGAVCGPSRRIKAQLVKSTTSCVWLKPSRVPSDAAAVSA